MLPTVDPTELVPVQFDFSLLLAAYVGAAITAQRITIELVSGSDGTPATRLYGASTVSDLVVTQFFDPDNAQSGAAKYRLTCNIDVAGTNYKPTIAVELTVNKRTDA